MKQKTIQERFWAKVRKGPGCWEWIGGRSNMGYGRFKVDGKAASPHRLVYEWVYGSIPEGYHVCHKCDNPGCVRPDHLFTGTHSDNMKDAARKGRLYKPIPIQKARGEQHGKSKLTAKQVLEIRHTYAQGRAIYKELGARYGVDFTRIGQIVRGEGWKHLL